MSEDVKPSNEKEASNGMTIVIDRPPVWDEAHKHFKLDDSRTVYTYGDRLYNPSGLDVSDDLLAHEATHADQQLEIEGGPAEWWRRYFADPKFRQEQELEAYQNQYTFYCFRVSRDRNARARFLNHIASAMSSSMYNAGITHVDAIRIIKGKNK